MNRTTILTRSAIAVTAGLLVAACGSSAKSSSSGSTSPTAAPTSAMPSMDMSSAAPAGTDTAAGAPTVHIKDFRFSDPSSPIKAGSTFTVINDDSVPHTYESVKKGGFDSGKIDAGKSAEVTAPAAGTYDIKCDFHPSMSGSLTVS